MGRFWDLKSHLNLKINRKKMVKKEKVCQENHYTTTSLHSGNKA